MKISELLNEIVSDDIEIKGLALDSRDVLPGYVFFAYQGTNHNGSDYIEDAIAKGASVIVTDILSEPISCPVPLFQISHIAQRIGEIAARFYDFPSKKMKIIGVTGTNGKTSCTHFIAQSLLQLNQTCGVIGTLGNGIYGQIKPSSLTTPDAITLQKTLAEFSKQTNYVAMEASSHSIDQGRINGIEFAIGIFTNLTRDHLDYHGTMEAYGNAKKKLFLQYALQNAIINIDDELGEEIIRSLGDRVAFGFSTQKKYSSVPLIFSENVRLSLRGIHADLNTPWGTGELITPLMGKFNLSNVLAVIAALCVLDIPLSTVLNCIAHLKPVPGRMETLGGKDKPLVIIDYAHTPDALEKVLKTMRLHCEGKLHCVFGCGGDRDRGKRPMMAKIAEQFSDHIVVTDDNPRFENADQIFKDISAGFTKTKTVQFHHDRALAIQEAIKASEPSDCILIAGKGAEAYQIIGEEKIPYNDKEVVEKYVR